MIRTESLLLKAARSAGYVLPLSLRKGAMPAAVPDARQLSIWRCPPLRPTGLTPTVVYLLGSDGPATARRAQICAAKLHAISRS